MEWLSLVFIVEQIIHFFFLVAFRIWKEHINESSTLIIAPEFSNYPQ